MEDILIFHHPDKIIKLKEGSSKKIEIYFSFTTSSRRFFPGSGLLIRELSLDLEIGDGRIISVSSSNKTITDAQKNLTMTVSALQMGRTTLNWTITDPDSGESVTSVIPVSVVRKDTNLQLIFTVVVGVLVSINNINMGCFIDLEKIKSVLRKPVAPVIGFACQFLFMPLASFAIGLLLFPDNISWRLGLFVLGCCPGGTASNFWTLLFDGDVDLSITMTFISTLAALGK
jgi:sodium/bile acid cotransporter 3/5